MWYFRCAPKPHRLSKTLVRQVKLGITCKVKVLVWKGNSLPPVSSVRALTDIPCRQYGWWNNRV